MQADKTLEFQRFQSKPLHYSITHTHRDFFNKRFKICQRLENGAGKLRDTLRSLWSPSNAINLSFDGGRREGWTEAKEKKKKKNHSKKLQTFSCQGLRLDRRVERNTSTQILWTLNYHGRNYWQRGYHNRHKKA